MDSREPRPLGDAAFMGPVGKLVRLLEPYSEAHPAAILLQSLTAFGSVIGRGAYAVVERDLHYGNLFVCMVGPSSRGRKGVSFGQAIRPYSEIDAEWATQRIAKTLGSGEGLVSLVRDPIYAVKGGQRTLTDTGVDDKRLLVHESELSGMLAVMGRDGSTLSAIIRQAWDGGVLSITTKNNPLKATDVHISIAAHVTRQDLLTELDRTQAANGFGNRFIWVWSKRSKLLPIPHHPPDAALEKVTRDLLEAVAFAKAAGEVRFGKDATTLWCERYAVLTRDRLGLFGALTSRAEAQTLRLAMLYALSDRSAEIGVEHLRAALEVWRYAEDTVRHIFGDAVGDRLADQVLLLLRDHPGSMSRTDLSNALGRNKRAENIDQALTRLLSAGLIERHEEPRDGPGRPATFYTALL